MTTAHRPTFDPARGKEAQRGVAYHQRLLPAHTQLKTRQPGQGGDADPQVRDLRAQLLEAEAAHFRKTNPEAAKAAESTLSSKRQLESGFGQDGEEDMDAKRRRILEETRDVDADSDGDKSKSSYEDSDDEEDETAELLRELEKIKRERAEQKEKEEREKAAIEQDQREKDIALGNPLLMPTKETESKRRWDDDVVFRNQARGTENKGKKEFVNDLLRSDFHKRFMSKYVR
ncbi:protein CWC15, partial [Lecanoromycetidae sp. Uapishka_2]